MSPSKLLGSPQNPSQDEGTSTVLVPGSTSSFTEQMVPRRPPAAAARPGPAGTVGPQHRCERPAPDTSCVTGQGHAHRPHLRVVPPTGCRKGRLRAECSHCSHPGEGPRSPGARSWGGRAVAAELLCVSSLQGVSAPAAGQSQWPLRCLRGGRPASAAPRAPPKALGLGPGGSSCPALGSGLKTPMAG